jgi:carboxypeptidase PM20D1
MKPRTIPTNMEASPARIVKRSRWRFVARLFFFGVFTPTIGLTLFLGFRDLDYSSRQLDTTPPAPLVIDIDKASATLSRSIQFKTVQTDERWNMELTPLSAFRSYLIAAYPTVFHSLKREVLGRDTMLISWHVDDDREKPILLMSHMDVQSAEEEGWTHRPFGGHDDGTFIWGRGTLDGKTSLIAILEAIKALLAEGFVPRRSIFVVFGADSKSGGSSGARAVADAFMERGHRLSYVLAPGPMIGRNLLPGVDRLVAQVGIAETGAAQIEISVKKEHNPSIHGNRRAVGIVAEAVYRIQETPFPARFNGTTRATFDFVGPELGLPDRVIYANTWLFEPLLKYRLGRKTHSTTMLRTLATPIAFRDSGQSAASPLSATAVLDLSIMPGDDVNNALKTLRLILKGLPVTTGLAAGAPIARPSPIARIRGPGFRDIQQTIGEIFPDVLVSPGLANGPTDARHFTHVTEDVYRFLPFVRRGSGTATNLSVNERVSKEQLRKAIEFYIQLVRNTAG